VDRTLHVSLEAVEAIHLGWEAGVPLPGRTVDEAGARSADLRPRTLSAFYLGLDSPVAVLQLQALVNGWREEPLTAILPAVALQQFFSLVGVAEDALLLVSGFVVLTGLAGMMTMVLASLSERRREMAILRSVGARPGHVLVLLLAEALVLTVLGTLLGAALVQALILAGGPVLEDLAGIRFAAGWPSPREWGLMGAVVIGGTLAGLVPAALAYRRSLADGLTVRL
jgi:putative ABC transport system permease protein